jgi:hypothetical protein
VGGDSGEWSRGFIPHEIHAFRASPSATGGSSLTQQPWKLIGAQLRILGLYAKARTGRGAPGE